MKKILHVSKYYYPFKGGTEQIARDCVNALKGEYDQRVICFNEKNNDSIDMVDNVEIIRAGCFTKISSQGLSLSYPGLLKEVIHSFNPDIIVFHYPNPFVAHFLLKLIPNNCRLIIYWHLDIVKQKILKQFFRRQNTKLLERANKLIATSPAYLEGSPYLSSVKDKCVIIPNCINTDRLQMTPRAKEMVDEIRRNNEGKTICFAAGRHTKYKGFEYLIQAAHLLDDSFRVYIAGSGEETKRLIRKAGNDNKIVFLGMLDDEELTAYYTAMDIFCFPSVTRNEAFGLSLAEAMYFGKPAVTFTIPGSGVNDVCLKDETGEEVLNRDVKKYGEAIEKLATDDNLRRKMGEIGKKRVKEHYLFESYQDKIVDVIE